MITIWIGEIIKAIILLIIGISEWKTYNITNDIGSDKIFQGFLGVPVSDSNNNYIVGDLIQPIFINTDLFGSNKIQLESFGWKKENDKLLIRYHLNSYLYDDSELEGIRIKITDQTGPYIIGTESQASNHNISGNSYIFLSTNLGGSNIELITRNQSNTANVNNFIQDRHYYSVEFEYKLTNFLTLSKKKSFMQ